MHRYWDSKELYISLFGKDVKLNSDQVKSLRRTLNHLPQQDTYEIITYGSLMNLNDSLRTLLNQIDRFTCVIKNYERIFNIGWKEQGSFLNIRHSKEVRDLYCVGITIDYKDLPAYIKREGLYNIVPIEFYLLDDYGEPDTQEFNGFTVISYLGDYGIEPQLNYFHLCLTGALQEMEDIGYNNFLDSTKCYSVKQHKYVMAREWLKELDLIDYMTRHSYSPR